jgi:hypothetical protein
MIDFKNAAFVKLAPARMDAFDVAALLVNGEEVIAVYQALRDGVVFTNKRVITVNVQGVTGKKKDFTSLPYSKIQAYSVETAGVFDLDAELILWFSGLGTVKLDFVGHTDITKICKMISEHVL